MEDSIANVLRDQSVVHALAVDRGARMGMADWEDEMRCDLRSTRKRRYRVGR